MTNALTLADLKVMNDEPRICDDRLAQVLGFALARNVRKIIRRNEAELRRHGRLVKRAIVHAGAGAPGEAYYLNEAQTILICMFSRTNQAAEVRAQIVEVFMAWRRGEAVKTLPRPSAKPRLALVDTNNQNWDKATKRAGQINTLARLDELLRSDDYARAVAHMPNVLYLDRGDGKRRTQRRPAWWGDVVVRHLATKLHRQCTLDEAIMRIALEVGEPRTPTRSSLGRYWLTLDPITAVA